MEYFRHGPYLDVEFEDDPPLGAKHVKAQLLNGVEDMLSFTSSELNGRLSDEELSATYATNEYVGTVAFGTNLEATDATVAQWIPNETTETGAAVEAQIGTVPARFAIHNYVNVRHGKYGIDGVAGGNDSAGFTAAIADAVAENKGLFIPAGNYDVDPGIIILPAGKRIIGDGSENTIIKSTQAKVGIGIEAAEDCEITGVYVRDFKEGLNNKGYRNKIHDNKFSYNTVGIHCSERSYITKIYNNDITFNNAIGVVAGNEVYQLDIHHNIIDNNNGIGVVTFGSSNGLIINDNTIEGNRNYDTGQGCGILSTGTNLSRCKIHGNWFEANGDTDMSADIAMAGPADNAEGYALVESIKTNLLPAEYLTLFGNGTCGTGAISIRNNSFVFTKYGAVVSGQAKTSITVEDNAFKARLDRYNKHVFLNFADWALNTSTQVKVDGNSYNNTNNAAVLNAQVETGVGGSIVHSPFAKTGLKGVTYNGEPLFEPEYTLDELADVAPLFVGSLHITSGTPTLTRYAVMNKAYDGYEVTGSGGVSYGTAPASADFAGMDGQTIFILSQPGGALVFTTNGAFSQIRSDAALPEGSFSPEKLHTPLDDGKAYHHDGVIYAVAIVPPENAYLFAGIAAVKVSDFQSQLVNP